MPNFLQGQRRQHSSDILPILQGQNPILPLERSAPVRISPRQEIHITGYSVARYNLYNSVQEWPIRPRPYGQHIRYRRYIKENGWSLCF